MSLANVCSVLKKLAANEWQECLDGWRTARAARKNKLKPIAVVKLREAMPYEMSPRPLTLPKKVVTIRPGPGLPRVVSVEQALSWRPEGGGGEATQRGGKD